MEPLIWVACPSAWRRTSSQKSRTVTCMPTAWWWTDSRCGWWAPASSASTLFHSTSRPAPYPSTPTPSEVNRKRPNRETQTEPRNSSCIIIVIIIIIIITVLFWSSAFHTATALRMDEKISAEEIFQHSKEVLTYMGEWELHGVTSKKLVLPASDGQPYDELRYYVRKHFNRLI